MNFPFEFFILQTIQLENHEDEAIDPSHLISRTDRYVVSPHNIKTCQAN